MILWLKWYSYQEPKKNILMDIDAKPANIKKLLFGLFIKVCFPVCFKRGIKNEQMETKSKRFRYCIIVDIHKIANETKFSEKATI